MKKKILIALAILAVIVIIAAGIGGKTIFGSNTKNTVQTSITIPFGATFEQVLDTLRSHDILRNEKSFKAVVQAMRFKTMRPGHYKIEPKSSNFELVRLLRVGQHYPVKFAFNNIRTIDQLVNKVDGKFFFNSKDLALLLKDSIYLQHFGFTPATIPAMFIPNSYDIFYDIPAEKFVEKMYENYQQFWTTERKEQAQSIGFTPIEVATLASIVEEENFRPAEKAIIAGLYINRLHKDMLLQADPTVKFALGDFARKRILNADLEIDSPYNTYKYKGLPPGPIRIPEGSTIDSVLHYAHHDHLYMCAKEDLSGYHNFTSSAATHAQNAARYRAALNRQNIRR